MKYISLFIMVLFVGFRLQAQENQGKNAPHLDQQSMHKLIASMTLEEKVRLVVGMGFRFQSPVPARRDSSSTSRDSTAAPTFRLPPIDPADNIPEKVPGAAGRTHSIPRLGIPSITVSDGPAGIRISPYRKGDSSVSYFATAFPSATLLASTWDTALVDKVGGAFGNEIREYGADIILGPAMNIQRNPLGGRNFEYYSEDPLVSGSMAASIVNGIQSNGVGTSIKHFVANNQETNRNSVNTIVSERALREIYLKGFELAVKRGRPWTVMTSYNKVNGTYTSENRELVTDILRKEWGFKGFVMTDWFGGTDPVAQMNAGNDLLMPGNPNQTKAILEAARNGKLDLKQLDLNVERILRVIRLSPEFQSYPYSNKPDLPAHAKISRQAANEGMVLLKNKSGTLPLTNGKKVALFGNTAYDMIAGGTGSGNVNKPYLVSLDQGMASAGFTVDNALADAYRKYLADAKAKRPRPRGFSFSAPPPIPEMPIDPETMAHKAESSDLAIITIGRNAGEGADRKIENDFMLSDAEKDLIQTVSTAFHGKGKKLVIVLNIGGVIEVASWRDQADAILLAWQPGLEAGNAVTDILSGRVNPSGKLAVSFPVNYTDDPTAKNFPGKELGAPPENASPMRGRPAEVTYAEGVYVGYRYYNSFHVKPAYEFGYGLSYTQFSYAPIHTFISRGESFLSASVKITNTGQVPGKEVVQCYVGAPGKDMDKPAEELRAFAKTKLLAPGESQTIRFRLTKADLASYDTEHSYWIAESGKYTIAVSASSEQPRQQATIKLFRKSVTERDSRLMSPATAIDELKRN